MLFFEISILNNSICVSITQLIDFIKLSLKGTGEANTIERRLQKGSWINTNLGSFFLKLRLRNKKHESEHVFLKYMWFYRHCVTVFKCSIFWVISVMLGVVLKSFSREWSCRDSRVNTKWPFVTGQALRFRSHVGLWQ